MAESDAWEEYLRALRHERSVSKNPGDFGPELILAKAFAPELVVVQTTKEVHYE